MLHLLFEKAINKNAAGLTANTSPIISSLSNFNKNPKINTGSNGVKNLPKNISTILVVNLAILLVCPLTKTKLIYDKKNNELISIEAKLAYPIIDNIPIMLPEKARNINV